VLLLEQILNGLLVGTYYTLLALGLSIIFSLGGVVNLAHGAFYAAGAYTIVFLSELIGFPSAFVATPILVGLIGIVVETFFSTKTLYQRPYPDSALHLWTSNVRRASLKADFWGLGYSVFHS